MRHVRTACEAVLVCFCFLTLTAVAVAHDSEPINTEFASPLARKGVNLNFDIQHLSGSADEALAGFGVEYGIARRMQFGVDLPLLRRASGPGRSAVGAGNLSLSYRYMFAGGNERRFAVSINPEAELPTGNPGIADRAYTAGAAIHVDANRGDKLWLHSNFGYTTPVARFEEKEKNFNFAVAGMYELTESWHSVIELFGRKDFNSSITEMSIAPEMIYSAGHHWELKIAVPMGTTSSTPAVGVQFRATWKLGPSERQ
jgi:hypothetical protein